MSNASNLAGFSTVSSGDGNFNAGIVTATQFVGDGSNITNVIAGAGASIVQGNTTAKVVDTGTDGIFVVETEGTEKFRIETNGGVGIGTTTSGDFAVRIQDGGLVFDGENISIGVTHLVGEHNTSVGEDAGLGLTSGDTNNTYIGFHAGQFSAGDLNGPNSSNTYIGDNAGNTSQGSGNIAIGVGAGIGHTNTDTSICIGSNARLSGFCTDSILIGRDMSASDKRGIIAIGASGNVRIYVDEDGNVGFGTTIPANDSSTHLQNNRLVVGTVDANNVLGASGVFDSLSGGFSNAFHIDGSAPVNSLQVDNLGNVGVNTGFARQKFHVDEGSLIVTGAGNLGIGTDDPTGTAALTNNTSTLAVGVATVGALHVNGNPYPSAGALSNRNLVINGGMQIAQRATERTDVTAGAACTAVDRWRNTMNALGTWTIRQSSDKPVGFTSSLEYVCTTADASPAAGGFVVIEQRVEAQNLQCLGFGNADARSFTVSFWVKSNKTGAASFDCYQDQEANQRMFSTSYTINSADTWEHKVINVPGDASGDIPNNSDIGLHLEWWLNGGSTFTGGAYQTTWANLTQANRNVQNLGVGGAINDNFKITGVQMELGDVATPFEHRSYGDDLSQCQRYFQYVGTLNLSCWSHQIADAGGMRMQTFTYPGGVMRTNPTLVYYDALSGGNQNKWAVEDPDRLSSNTNTTLSPGITPYMFTGGFKYPGAIPNLTLGQCAIANAYRMQLSAEL